MAYTPPTQHYYHCPECGKIHFRISRSHPMRHMDGWVPFPLSYVNSQPGAVLDGYAGEWLDTYRAALAALKSARD